MFFSISKSVKENFPNQFVVGDFIINTDAGWKQKVTNEYVAIYKGYVDDAQLTDILPELVAQTIPTRLGNFCVIVVDRITHILKISSDLYRSFPIYYNHKEVTNLEQLSNTVYTDNIITVSKDLSVEYPLKSNFDLIGTIDEWSMSESNIVDSIDAILTEKTKNFIKYNHLPIKVHLSGGVDSLLVYSYLQKYTDNYELVMCQHLDYDAFWLLNSNVITKNWGYNQIHHWRDLCILTSGAPGDEFMLRSPTTVDRYLKHRDINILDILKEDSLHYKYFNRPKHIEIFKDQVTYRNLSHGDLYRNLCDTIVNDWQHWHLGNTLTWTPLRDLRIFKLMLKLPESSAIRQITDSSISQQLIERNFPGGSKLLSDQKNSGPAMKNLLKFYQKFGL